MHPSNCRYCKTFNRCTLFLLKGCQGIRTVPIVNNSDFFSLLLTRFILLTVTHEEIEAGLLLEEENPNMKCLCFIRNIEDLYSNINHHRAAKFIDLLPAENGDPAEIDTEAQERLETLRDNDIPKKLNKENIVKLSTTWSNKGGINSTHNAQYLNKISQTFYERMTWLIDQNLSDKEIEEDEQTREIRQSLILRNNWSNLFFGRNDILGALERYLVDPSKTSPIVVYGESGSGKTALIAKCAKETRRWMSSSNPVVIVRFLGVYVFTFFAALNFCKKISPMSTI